MAINTAFKRRNVAGVLPAPDGTIGLYDLRAAAGVYALLAILGTAYKRRNAAGVAPGPDGYIGTHDRRAIVRIYAMDYRILVFFAEKGLHMMIDSGGGTYRLIWVDVD